MIVRVATSTDDTVFEKVIVSTEYFDLVGKPVSKETKGFVIVRVMYEDGSYSVQKLFIKYFTILLCVVGTLTTFAAKL